MYKSIPYDPSDLECYYIDVRSESEYEKGHIPNAKNLPILSNEERHVVGDLYKNVSVDAARRKGLEFVSQKLMLYFDAINELINQNPKLKIVFYCSRGGYRSTSIALLLKGIGIPVSWLQGGYKNYRQLVLEHLSDPLFYPKMLVIHGLSGVGKTHVLTTLESDHLPVLDLEGLAMHKGSHLGHIGIEQLQTQQNFENLVFEKIFKMPDKYCFVESESKRIGPVFMPQTLYNCIQAGIHSLLNAAIEFRVDLLVKDYSLCDDFDAQLRKALTKLSIYTSKAFLEDLEQLIQQKNYAQIAEKLLLEYYDPIYKKSIVKHEYAIQFEVRSIRQVSDEIINWYTAISTPEFGLEN
ncbi:tRNA 2-selenouridine(34) synthase MnmH [Fusibacter sp. 3D3]|uniref:tRNA 2-selenouridine(34) synthase MnmH n=1 Tax=Fusibacter sp. 3D3 TaxID=1048380 RepID=UPI000853EAD4|nr:tRNA 2-selenouridine(34) synthase MnmH [Fusibacter sp. 3D3]GAU76076.1 selenophosphate-dependent tRNA 2-selenouridine synthase [Fusibacter sp. 3D3]